MGRGSSRRQPRSSISVEFDRPAMRVSARCRCGRDVYFRYGIGPDRALLVENEEFGGGAILRCAGCSELARACPCPEAA